MGSTQFAGYDYTLSPVWDDVHMCAALDESRAFTSLAQSAVQAGVSVGAGIDSSTEQTMAVSPNPNLETEKTMAAAALWALALQLLHPNRDYPRDVVHTYISVGSLHALAVQQPNSDSSGSSGIVYN